MIEDLWYKNAIIYSLDLDTFMDGNGDGVGDFEGLDRRLDYLQTLGVDIIWIAPFQPSPNRDNGYDVSDYYGVDPRHGSSGDFVEFLNQAKKRGFKIIIDLVVNHTSDQHRWFQEARSDPQSKYRDWYVWSKKRPPDWNRGMVFPGVQKSTWTYDRQARAYYFHRFYDHQPDLNMKNPEVRTEVRRIIGYWLQLGVDGFRLDAVPFIVARPSPERSKVEHHFEYLEEMRGFLQWRAGDAVFLGEANVEPSDIGNYFQNGRGIHMMFNFWVNQHLFYALAAGEVGPLVSAIKATRDIPESAQWAQFLRNHDELDLGRLTSAQREVVFSRFAPDPDMRLYERGIRRRLAPMLGNRAHLELAYSVLFALPGTPVLRYGDEIGMGEDLSLVERDAVRTPMQWSPHEAGGFSTARRLVHPIIRDGAYGFPHINVENQKRDHRSLLRWMARMIRVRKECPEVGWGSCDVLETGSPSVLALSYHWRGNTVITIHNFADQPVDVTLAVKSPEGDRLVDMFAEGISRADSRGRHHLPVEAYGYRWYRAGRLDYALTMETEKPVRREPARKRPRSGPRRRAGD